MQFNFIYRFQEVILIILVKRNLYLFLTIIFYFFTGSGLYGQSIHLPVPAFRGPLGKSNNAGQIKLIWSLPDSINATEKYTFELQQAEDSLFNSAKLIYSGSDLASFISGLPNGDYFFRIRAQREGENEFSHWSETAILNVKHQSLKLAFTLFGLGALVFLSTVSVILYGNRKTEKGN